MGRVTVRYRRGGKWYAHAMHMTECTDVPTPLQAEGDMLLHVASRRGDPDAVQALVDSKADLEARNEVAMLPVQPGVCHICGGGDDAIEGGAAVWCMIRACN